MAVSCSTEKQAPKARASEKAPAATSPDKTEVEQSQLGADAKVELETNEVSEVTKQNGCVVNKKYQSIAKLTFLTAQGILGSKDDQTSKIILAVLGLINTHFEDIQTGTITANITNDTVVLLENLISGFSQEHKLAVHIGVSAALKTLNIKCSEGGLQVLDLVHFLVSTMQTIPEEMKSDSGNMSLYLDLILEAAELLND